MTYEEHLQSDFGSLLVERAQHMARIDELENENARLTAELVKALKEKEGD